MITHETDRTTAPVVGHVTSMLPILCYAKKAKFGLQYLYNTDLLTD